VDVSQPHAHLRRRRGKIDVVDAEAAARKVLSGEATAIPEDIPMIAPVCPRYCEQTQR